MSITPSAQEPSFSWHYAQYEEAVHRFYYKFQERLDAIKKVNSAPWAGVADAIGDERFLSEIDKALADPRTAPENIGLLHLLGGEVRRLSISCCDLPAALHHISMAIEHPHTPIKHRIQAQLCKARILAQQDDKQNLREIHDIYIRIIYDQDADINQKCIALFFSVLYCPKEEKDKAKKESAYIKVAYHNQIDDQLRLTALMYLYDMYGYNNSLSIPMLIEGYEKIVWDAKVTKPLMAEALSRVIELLDEKSDGIVNFESRVADYCKMALANEFVDEEAKEMAEKLLERSFVNEKAQNKPSDDKTAISGSKRKADVLEGDDAQVAEASSTLATLASSTKKVKKDTEKDLTTRLLNMVGTLTAFSVSSAQDVALVVEKSSSLCEEIEYLVLHREKLAQEVPEIDTAQYYLYQHLFIDQLKQMDSIGDKRRAILLALFNKYQSEKNFFLLDHLLRNNIIMSAINEGALYPMHDAVNNGDVERVQLLLKHESLREFFLTSIDGEGRNALTCALDSSNNQKLVQLLLEAHEQTQGSYTPLSPTLYGEVPTDHLAEEIQPVLSSEQEKKLASLHKIVRNGNIEDAKRFFRKVAPADKMPLLLSKSRFKQTVLHVAVVEHRDPNLIKLLLQEAGTEAQRLLEARDCDGDTPLHLAISYTKKNLTRLEVLLSFSSNQTSLLLAENNHGLRPIFKVFQNEKNERLRIYLLKTLIKEASTIKDIKNSPLLCSDENNMTLLHWIAKINCVTSAGLLNKCRGISEILAIRSDSKGKKPLHYAARNQLSPIAVTLLKLDCFKEQMVPANNGKTPLHYAVKKNAMALMNRMWEKNQAVFKKCLFLGDNEGMTPLHYAAINGKGSVVEAFLKIAGDDKNRLREMNDYRGKRAVDYARLHRNSPLVSLLLS